MQHIIRKQTIIMQLSKKNNAFEMQHLMSSLFWQQILPALEKLFDEACPHGETICIDKLELDLGILTEQQLYGQALPETLVAALARQFYEKLSAGASGSKTNVQFKATSLGVVQQWLYYMQHGYLPWNTLKANQQWKQEALQGLAKDEASINLLRQLLQKNSRSAYRMASQHNEKFLLQLIQILGSCRLPALPRLLVELNLMMTYLTSLSDGPKQHLKLVTQEELWAHALRFTATHAAKPEAKSILQSMLHVNDVPVLYLQNAINSLTPQLTALPRLVEVWLAEKHIPKPEKSLPAASAPQQTIPSPQPPQYITEQTQPHETSEEEITIDEEGIFVQHAGLVLLHPFIPVFFSRLKLTAEGRFVNLAAQQKALYLLNYLATGKTIAEEYELVIPKVLCAYPLQKPVPKKAHILTEETDEADELLQEAIRQWVILKSTSPASLREEFLQRCGKLISKNDSLHLQLETSAADVLLDYLPWNLSMIKLPWIERLLHVTWR